ncbi:glycosyltransferase family 4 protein [Pectinatus frisingensis]|uniref:glycosyltransferase family 4 protein n=1 Tax=Pectinatus frisingensis TaxID=865 RepID=UPI002ED90531
MFIINNSTFKIAFLSTYPPQKCGIATFTQDLIRELKKLPQITPVVIAVRDDYYKYDSDVIFSIPQQDRQSYTVIADKINLSDIDAVVIEHEYGIFGGDSGEYLLDFVNKLQKPLLTTLHTVLPKPEKIQQKILACLCEKSKKIIIMAENSRKLLQEIYGAVPEKIEKIHHGVPYFNFPSRETLKQEFGFESRTIISTFGLLSPSKGIDYGIDAIRQSTQKHPDILYLILGQTHPVIRKSYGESYRNLLKKLVRDYDLQNNVSFVNKYLTKQEIVRWLKLSDIYMTPYLGQEQAVSGTLAYATGCGRVIVSTPYPYAQEMLAEGRGLLAKFEDSMSLSNCINYIIEHPDEKKLMEEKTLLLGKDLRWQSVAQHYAKIFQTVCHTSNIIIKSELPDDTYIFRLTDDTGIFQHALNSVPDPSEGYTSDDNARAMIMAGWLFKTTRNDKYLELLVIYLRFLIYAQSNGWFRNFMDYSRRFIEEKGSEDCFGRCVWSLGFTASLNCLPADIRNTAAKLLQNTLPHYKSLSFIRAKAYSIVGLSLLHDPENFTIVNKLASELALAYDKYDEPDWHWFDTQITYCNAVLPAAMLHAYSLTTKDTYKSIGIKSLDFLLKKTFIDDIFHPIGCKGWLMKGQSPAIYDEQPVEACSTLLACVKAYKITHEPIYLQRAHNCYQWYLGKNIAGRSTIDTHSGGCIDGITSTGLNKNEGSESLIAWILAATIMTSGSN